MTIEINKSWRAKSWSFSAISQYEACPWQYYLSRAEKMQSEPGYALVNGIKIHSLFEEHLNGNVHGIPPELSKFANEMRALKRHGAIAEEAIVLDRLWNPIESENPWSDRSAWIRAKIDARIGNLVVDIKTGKSYPKYREQGELYATMLFQAYPEIGDEICTEFWYTKTGEVESFTFKKSDHEDTLNRWDKRASKLMLEKNWLPKKNWACRFCHVQHECELFA